MDQSDILSKRLLIISGKGGVGKSTVSAALALVAARRGQRVLVCEVNAKERVSSLLGARTASGPEVTQVQDRIWTVNMKPADAMREYVVNVVGLRILYNVVFDNRLMRYFLRAVPGLQELVLIGKTWHHATETLDDGSPRFDLVVLDAPATGHSIGLLRIPQVVLDIAPDGPMRRDTEKVRELLTDPARTAVNLVTLPEEMPATEATELYGEVRDLLGLPMGCLFINRVPPPPTDKIHGELLDRLPPEPAASDPPLAGSLLTCARTAQSRTARALAYVERLARDVPLPAIQLPQLFQMGFRREAASTLADVIERSIAAADDGLSADRRPPQDPAEPAPTSESRWDRSST